jgi:hypothetical protein
MFDEDTVLRIATIVAIVSVGLSIIFTQTTPNCPSCSCNQTCPEQPPCPNCVCQHNQTCNQSCSCAPPFVYVQNVINWTSNWTLLNSSNLNITIYRYVNGSLNFTRFMSPIGNNTYFFNITTNSTNYTYEVKIS